MTQTNLDAIVIGGGIVGLATAWALTQKHPGTKVAVLEKEAQVAAHQTGRNSGVIHSGIYYKPGSFKAEFSKLGRNSMVAFCREQGIPYDLCGKLIVATTAKELPRLENLYQRGLENGLAVEKLTADQARKIEPHVNCVAAIRVPETGITDYRKVCEKLLELIRSSGGEVHTGTLVTAIHSTSDGVQVMTSVGEFRARTLINCAGLQSDRVAKMAGLHPKAKIVPFRGEYYELSHDKCSLVKALIYPVPDPEFPFLGVHFTRMIDGSVHAGPNAVLALKREGYSWGEVSLTDLAETLLYSGFQKLARKNLRSGLHEMTRSFFKRRFVHSLQQLVPEVRSQDLVPSQAGVRAQALLPDGKLVDDFLIERGSRSVHVLNAPSPAATCSLEIGRWIADQLQ